MTDMHLSTEYGNLYPYEIDEYTHYCNGEKYTEYEAVYLKNQDIPDIPTPFMAEYIVNGKTVAVAMISRIRVKESWDAE